jgi:hypothetical protein
MNSIQRLRLSRPFVAMVAIAVASAILVLSSSRVPTRDTAGRAAKAQTCTTLVVHLRGRMPPDIHCSATAAVKMARVALSSGLAVTPATVVDQCGASGPPNQVWAAFYWDVNFSGPQLCFTGTGSIDLSNYDGYPGQTWRNHASSINIAARGQFFDQNGSALGFYRGMRVSDLRTMGWNDRISSFQIVG